MGDFDRFRPLPVSECLQLLTASRVGRVVWNSTHGPRVLPVAYALHDKRSESSFGHRFAVLSPSLRIRTQLPSKSMRSTKL